MSRGVPQPLLRTPAPEFNDVEKAKLAGVTPAGVVGAQDLLRGQFRDDSAGDVQAEAEQLAKSHGIYLEYNRATTGREKDWSYMIRLSSPGGGAFTRETWRVVDEVAQRYTQGPGGKPSIRLTTRQNIQYHWVKKADLIPLVGDIARTGFFALNGCGDNTRNVMACPLSRFSTLYDAHAHAHHFGKYFELPSAAHVQIFEIDTSLLRFDGTRVSEPRGEGDAFAYGPALLNRKFKIAFSTAHRDAGTGRITYDNCVEARTNDMGIAPVLEDGRLVAFQVYIGGGQGEKNGKASFATLGRPVALFTPGDLQKGLDAIVRVHQDWGDRKNRHWARLKYVVNAQGIPWYQDEMRALGATFEQPIDDFDVGPRHLHHGWHTQESNGRLSYGMFVENGRLIDRDPATDNATAYSGSESTANNHERLRSLVRRLADTFDTELMITPNQDLLFTNLDPAAKTDFEAQLARDGYGQRRGKAYSSLRLLSGACVGLPTCRLSYTDSEQFEPELIDTLENLGYGDVGESIGITGCERQCFRPATKTLGWVGQGPDMYMLKIGGGEDGRHQGTPFVEGDKLFLRQVPRAGVAVVTAALFDFYHAHREPGEDMGGFHRRVGHAAVLAYLRDNPATAGFTQKSAPAPYLPPEQQQAQLAQQPALAV